MFKTKPLNDWTERVSGRGWLLWSVCSPAVCSPPPLSTSSPCAKHSTGRPAAEQTRFSRKAQTNYLQCRRFERETIFYIRMEIGEPTQADTCPLICGYFQRSGTGLPAALCLSSPRHVALWPGGQTCSYHGTQPILTSLTTFLLEILLFQSIYMAWGCQITINITCTAVI